MSAQQSDDQLPQLPQLPSLSELRKTLNSGNLEQLQLMREKMNWDLPVGKVVLTEHVDCAYDLVRDMVDNYGPLALNSKESSGETLVHRVVLECQSEKALDLILETGEADCLKRRGEFNYTVFHYAAQNPHNTALKWLVKTMGSEGLGDSGSVNGLSPVHISAQFQTADSMKLYASELDAACFRLVVPDTGLTVCHFAAMNCVTSGPLEWLVKEVGADLLTVKCKEGDTPVHLAARFQGETSMKLAFEHIGEQMFSLTDKYNENVVQCAAQNTDNSSGLAWCIRQLGPKCMMPAGPRIAPIHLSAENQGKECLELMVSLLGPDCLKVKDNLLRTPVHFAAMNVETTATLRWMVGLLGPDCLTWSDGLHNMPIHLAAQYQGIDTLQFIKETLGPDAFKLEGLKRKTMVHYASRSANREEKLHWMASEIGEKCLRMSDAVGNTPTSLAA